MRYRPAMLARLKAALAHAFALPADDPLDAHQTALLDRIAAAVRARRMELPAAMALQSVRPLGGLAAQSTHTIAPFLELAVPPEQIDAATRLMQHPRAVDELLARLQPDDD